ncbi:hypothetical protein PHYBOEH_011570 [Phytophthora boehmeriae]|uniref:m7GpppX diphosphatase n=1 Tax=Phytophthora boehmeriae TaxID=109152 RepID=A0A8T1WY46_9STRA|nr:hypothetical protein PHYBOEH_011570 [Phytophthora boehmeriae]
MNFGDNSVQADTLRVHVALVIVVLCALFAWRQAYAGIGSKRLRDFRLEKVLKRTDTELTILGNFHSDLQKRNAVLIIQTAAMDTSGLDALLNKLSLHEILINDIYSTYQGDVSRDIKPYKVNIIFPATEKHVLKHTDQHFHMVVETKETFWTITKPFIGSIPTESLEWVYNILEHKSETERIIFEDSDLRDGFILLPDFKWSDQSNLESLYCLAIVHDRSLRSLRDLTGSHLTLLRNIRDASLKVLKMKFGVAASSLRLYIHYQPTYYHFHVHFSHIKMTHGTFAGKAVLLEDVIYNLSVNSDHYKNATLSFVVGELQHKPLFELFREKLIIKVSYEQATHRLFPSMLPTLVSGSFSQEHRATMDSVYLTTGSQEVELLTNCLDRTIHPFLRKQMFLDCSQVLQDLVTERGLINWQVVNNVRISSDSSEQAHIIYGYALTAILEEERIDRRRKRKAGVSPATDEQPTWSCFLVLPAISSAAPTFSIKRLLELQRCADANEPSSSSTSTRRTFLCLTDSRNIRISRVGSLCLVPGASLALSLLQMRLQIPRALSRASAPTTGRSKCLQTQSQRCVTTITTGDAYPSKEKDRPLPLKGIRVVECGHLIAGPFAGTILSYFGADVIKVESPTGDQVRDYRELDSTKTSLWWYSLGRNKRSISIDMKKDEGRALIKELITQSDVFIENFKPGRMEKWGLGPDHFEKTNPELVYARVSGFGQDGPYSSRPGFASVCEAMGGFRYVNGFPDRPPARPNLSVGDTVAGIHAALGIVIALLGRERATAAGLIGKGQVVDVAIYESMFNLMEAVVPEYDYSGSIRECSGSTITGIVPSNTYITKDGKYVVLAANTDGLFVKLMNAIGREDMATDSKYRTNGDRVVHQDVIDAVLVSWTATQTLETVVETMERATVPVGLVYSVEDMVKDPHYLHRELFEEVTIPDGDSTRTLKLPAIMPKLKSTPGETQFAGRKLGEDTRQVLQDVLERSPQEIERLLKDKVVFEPSP